MTIHWLRRYWLGVGWSQYLGGSSSIGTPLHCGSHWGNNGQRSHYGLPCFRYIVSGCTGCFVRWHLSGGGSGVLDHHFILNSHQYTKLLPIIIKIKEKAGFRKWSRVPLHWWPCLWYFIMHILSVSAGSKLLGGNRKSIKYLNLFTTWPKYGVIIPLYQYSPI